MYLPLYSSDCPSFHLSICPTVWYAAFSGFDFYFFLILCMKLGLNRHKKWRYFFAEKLFSFTKSGKWRILEIKISTLQLFSKSINLGFLILHLMAFFWIFEENFLCPKLGKWISFLDPKSTLLNFFLNLIIRISGNYTWWQPLKSWYS